MEEILMGTQEKMEREINLLDLFWGILLSWRQIICFGVIFAILLGGVKYVRDIRAYQSVENVDIEEKEQELTEDEIQQVLNARNLLSRIKEYEEYLANSALMQMNLYQKPVVELQYYVDSDYTFNYTQENQNDYSNDLLTMYTSYILSGEMSTKVIDVAGLSVNQADFSEFWSVSQNGNSIMLKVTCPEEEKMGVVAETIKTQLSKKEAEFQEIGAHKLKLMTESENVVVDNSLVDRRNSISSNIASFGTQLNNLKANMSDQQLALLVSEQEESEEEDPQTLEKPGISFKFMILGAVFGVFLICIWLACKMIFAVKLQNPDEIRTIYNTRLLGEVEIQSEKKRFLSVIDDKLLAIKNRRKKKLTAKQQVSVITANIALSCKQQGIACIFMTGSEFESADATILAMLKQELSAQGIQVKEGGNIFYDAESLKQGTEIGNILFIEQKGQSIYDEISNELNLANEQKNNILGFVVLV